MMKFIFVVFFSFLSFGSFAMEFKLPEDKTLELQLLEQREMLKSPYYDFAQFLVMRGMSAEKIKAQFFDHCPKIPADAGLRYLSGFFLSIGAMYILDHPDVVGCTVSGCMFTIAALCKMATSVQESQGQPMDICNRGIHVLKDKEIHEKIARKGYEDEQQFITFIKSQLTENKPVMVLIPKIKSQYLIIVSYQDDHFSILDNTKTVKISQKDLVLQVDWLSTITRRYFKQNLTFWDGVASRFNVLYFEKLDS